jgi:hypothetical protein
MDDQNNPFAGLEDAEPVQPTEAPSFFDRVKQKLGLTGQSADTPAREKQPEIDDAGTLYEKVVEEGTGIGRLLAKIPGIGGYMDKSRRREADALLRRTIAGRLRESRALFASVYQELSQDISLAIDFAEPLGRTDTRLVGLISKIEDAPSGYAGFFSPVKIKEEELARIYRFDEQLFDHAETIGIHVAALQKAVGESIGIRDALRELDSAVQNVQLAFNARQELLSGFA